ncbi:MAG: glycine/sarcosine/betaine reductase selenoprotein B family protein [Thermoanaerobaculia bacterium]|nr:glycine/sarcosine/betaine reductase selenoprotein B family protein [Thermoanaerobaculia bacterium]
MLNISRRCIPFTPYDKDLASATVTLVCATGVYAPGQAAFATEDPGDIDYRVIAGDANVADFKIAHHHYDHTEADGDPNIVFPLATLQELAAKGVIGAVNDKHYSYGFTTRLKELYEKTFPEIADNVEKSKTKLVILMAGCPETCHRSISNLAREIESRGVPTIVISANPAASESTRPPRGMTWEGCAVGHLAGAAGDRAHHEKVVLAALNMFLENTPPGKVISKF